MTLPPDLAANPILSRWISIGDDGRFHVRVGRVELGQGILTAFASIAAGELGVDPDRVVMVPASTEGPDQGVTAGSMSIARTVGALALVCANVRVLLERGGPVDLDVPADPGVPTPGRTVASRRIDLPDKIAGRPRYIHDLRLPGMLFGRVIRPPSPGAELVSAGAPPDVRLARDGSFLGVVAESPAEADRAVRATTTTWRERDTLPDEDDLITFLRAGPHEEIPIADDGPPPERGHIRRATYSRPFLAHASIAPSCGIALWEEDGRLRVWTHSQGIFPLRAAIAAALGLDPERITVEHVEGAGCYGHNAADDAAFDAVLLARDHPGRPVRVEWSRRDELTWAPFGSAMAVDVVARTGDDGRILSWEQDIWSQGHLSRPGYAGVPGLLAGAHLDRPLPAPAPVDPSPASGRGLARNAEPIYKLPHRRVVGHRLTETPIRTSALRSLGAHMNIFAIESFLDELALEAGRDRLEYRLAHLGDPRARRVLEVAAEAAGWGRTMPESEGLGIGLARYKGRGAYCAVVAEVEAVETVRVRCLVCAVDVGRVIDPDGVRNQIEGGATQATSWTLKERVRFDRRRITSGDWESYPILRFSEAPEIAVEIMARDGDPPVGAGEAAQGPTTAAIGNALAAALGVRLRHLPFTTEAVIAAIS